MMRTICPVCHRFLINNFENMLHAKVCRGLTGEEFHTEIKTEGIYHDLFKELKLTGRMR